MKCSSPDCINDRYDENGWLCPPHKLESAIVHEVCDFTSVLDVGAGLGAYHPTLHRMGKKLTLLDAHAVYFSARKLPKGVTQICGALQELLPIFKPEAFDAVLAIDVIEHLTREDGEQMLQDLFKLEPKKICIFTPYGFYPQDKDPHELGADHWQTHRSGWIPKDFGFKKTEVWKNFHVQNQPSCPDAIWAVWTRS